MKRKLQSGFSLIEVMIAVTVLITLVIGAASVVYQAGVGIQRQQSKREAVVAANHVIEEFWNYNYSDLYDLRDSVIERSRTVNGLVMNVSIEFSAELTDVGGDDFIEITVDIDHADASDDIILTSRRYKYGPSRAAL